MTGTYALRNASELRERLLHALDQPGLIVVEAGGAESADITTVQVLLAAQKSAAAKGKNLEIRATADSAIVKLMAATGLLPSANSTKIPELKSWIISGSVNDDQNGSDN